METGERISCLPEVRDMLTHSCIRTQYEKTAETVKATLERVDTMTKDFTKEQSDINADRELIKEIMRLLGILEDRECAFLI